MQFHMTKIAAALALCVSGAAFAADDAPDGGIGTLVDLDITSGTFFMAGVTGAPVAFGAIGFDLVDGYGSQAALFEFFGGPVSVFTGDGTTAPFGATPVVGGPVPSGTTTATTIDFDLSAFTANWNGTNFNQGDSMVTGTYDPVTGAFSATWDSLIVGGPFNGFTGTWSVSGVAAAAVPEAETYAMMLAGLGLVGTMVARRRKLVA